MQPLQKLHNLSPIRIVDPSPEGPVLEEHRAKYTRWMQDTGAISESTYRICTIVSRNDKPYQASEIVLELKHVKPLKIRNVLRNLFKFIFFIIELTLILINRWNERQECPIYIRKGNPILALTKARIQKRSLHLRNIRPQDSKLLNLPAEIFHLILKFLRLNDTITLQSVCKGLTQIIPQTHFWKRYSKLAYFPVRNMPMVALYTSTVCNEIIKDRFLRGLHVDSFLTFKNMHEKYAHPTKIINDSLPLLSSSKERFFESQLDPTSIPHFINYKGEYPYCTGSCEEGFAAYFQEKKVLLVWDLASPQKKPLHISEGIHMYFTEKPMGLFLNKDYIVCWMPSLVVCWSRATGHWINSLYGVNLQNITECISACALAGDLIYLGDNLGNIQSYKINHKKLSHVERSWKDNPDGKGIKNFIPFEGYLFCQNQGGEVNLWNVKTLEKVKSFKHSKFEGKSMSISSIALWHGLLIYQIKGYMNVWNMVNSAKIYEGAAKVIHPYIEKNGKIGNKHLKDLDNKCEWTFLHGKILFKIPRLKLMILRDYAENADPLAEAFWKVYEKPSGARIEINS